jgi:ribose transport system ATP-binding protein
MAEYAMKMNNIVKSFDGVCVLKDISLEVGLGEIHTLLGENGAGKSTLMNILGGVLPMDSGELYLFGEKVKIQNPSESQDLGIAFIHQELNVVNDLKVYENMFLGYELANKLGKLDKKTMCQKTQEVFERMNVEIDPNAMVRDLAASYKQIIEIAKALLRNAKIIIMDEPTTSLTTPEIENVFRIMRTLVRENVSIIFISHKLGEVVDFCDCYTVLRNGEKVCEGKITDKSGYKVTTTELAKQMVGRDVLGVNVYKEHEISDVILEVDNVRVGNYAKNISFSLRRGEILGFTGLLGDGKEELVRSLFGDMKIDEGTVKLHGKVVKISSPKKAHKLRIGFLPANRKENAIIKDLSIEENMTISTLRDCCRGITVIHKKEKEIALKYKQILKIKTGDLKNKITSLSGGNQQKVIFARWMNTLPEVMILCNPTQGVDVGAKNEIYNEIYELAKKGVAIIITSGEAQEIIKLSDRVKVMYHGEIKGELSHNELSEETIMILATGAKL